MPNGSKTMNENAFTVDNLRAERDKIKSNLKSLQSYSEQDVVKRDKAAIKAAHEYEKKLTKQLVEYEWRLRRAEQLKALDFSEDAIKDQLDYEAKKKEEQHQKSIEIANKFGGIVQGFIDTGIRNIETRMSNMKANVDSAARQLTDLQQSMAYALTGSEMRDQAGSLKQALENVTNNFKNIFGSDTARQGTIKLESLYNNYAKLIQEGILYNAEQRAFLETVTDDLNMVFNAQDGSLTRLINLQREDISEQRVAMEYSLKTFLNQNYETSQYIKNGFANVSQALFEAQATMTKDAAVGLESVVQQWLGAFSSVGASESAISSLASAIGSLGSGGVEDLAGTNIGNLIFLGASRAGLSAGDILHSGLSGSNADLLMQGIFSYLGEAGASDSNVVRSQIAKMLGISISDLRAAAQVGNVTSRGVIGTNIEDLLNTYTNTKSGVQVLETALANLGYAGGLDLALNEELYRNVLLYSESQGAWKQGGQTLGNLAGSGLGAAAGLIPVVGPFISGAVGSIASSALGALGSYLGDAVGAAAYGVSDYFEKYGDIGKMLRSVYEQSPGAYLANANSLYQALAASGDTQYIKSSGLMNYFTRQTGLSTSGATIFSQGSRTDIEAQSYLAQREHEAEVLATAGLTEYGMTDIYNLLSAFTDRFPENPWPVSTISKIDSVDNTVSVSGMDPTYIEDMTGLIAYNTLQIVDILTTKFAGQTNLSWGQFALTEQTFDKFSQQVQSSINSAG